MKLAFFRQAALFALLFSSLSGFAQRHFSIHAEHAYPITRETKQMFGATERTTNSHSSFLLGYTLRDQFTLSAGVAYCEAENSQYYKLTSLGLQIDLRYSKRIEENRGWRVGGVIGTRQGLSNKATPNNMEINGKDYQECVYNDYYAGLFMGYAFREHLNIEVYPFMLTKNAVSLGAEAGTTNISMYNGFMQHGVVRLGYWF